MAHWIQCNGLASDGDAGQQLKGRICACSDCGKTIITNGIDKTGKALVATAMNPYCRWCGASMREDNNMTLNEYQSKAARTINYDITFKQMEDHALKGMCAELGEVNGIHQKIYQGHQYDEEHAKKELGDLLWFIAEYCTAHDWSLNEVAQKNIDKLMARYPDGFNADKSLHRKNGDI